MDDDLLLPVWLIPFLALPNDPWGDEALKTRGAFSIQRHDRVRDELAMMHDGHSRVLRSH